VKCGRTCAYQQLTAALFAVKAKSPPNAARSKAGQAPEFRRATAVSLLRNKTNQPTGRKIKSKLASRLSIRRLYHLFSSADGQIVIGALKHRRSTARAMPFACAFPADKGE
jgi:hypothetical protein